MSISSTAPTSSPSGFRFIKTSAALFLTAIIAAGSILMIGPQIVIIVPMAIAAGIAFALRRSFWSLVCFGYPLTFGLISALIGYMEMPGYERTVAFGVSIGLGLVGVSLIAAGLWKVLPGRDDKETSGLSARQ
jgi:hypothetical protein